MQKPTLIFAVIVLAVALSVPIFADEISQALGDNNSTNSSTNDSAVNNTLGNNSSISDNSTFTNSTLAPEQLQTLQDTQTKLAALIATIESLKATYGDNTKAKGLLNALDQYKKQAERLNSEIDTFIQNPTVDNGTESIDGRINSFVKRAAALEHKVAVKQELLAKMATKAKQTKTKVKKQKKQN